jgi:hypothetical protein
MTLDWDTIEPRLVDILRDSVPQHPNGEYHPFGQRLYVTAYQLASLYISRYGNDTGRVIGGEGTGRTEIQPLAQYIALRLSDRIRSNTPPPIEGAWFSTVAIRQWTFAQNVEASKDNPDIALFRYRDE